MWMQSYWQHINRYDHLPDRNRIFTLIRHCSYSSTPPSLPFFSLPFSTPFLLPSLTFLPHPYRSNPHPPASPLLPSSLLLCCRLNCVTKGRYWFFKEQRKLIRLEDSGKKCNIPPSRLSLLSLQTSQNQMLRIDDSTYEWYSNFSYSRFLNRFSNIICFQVPCKQT